MFDLEIINFQSIAHTRLTIEGFTTIVGPSNRGKSAVLRALRAILYNELHPSYIREGAKECTLRIHFPESAPHDVRQIEFVKSSTKNVYTIIMRDGTMRPYPKAGNETPPEVQALGFTKVTTERDETFNLNFQRQLETLFLVCDTPTTFTSFMQKVFRLERYERALRNINSDLLKVGREHDQVGIDLISKQRDLEAITENLQNKRSIHDTLDAALKTLDTSEQRLANLQAARTKLVEVEQHRATIATSRATAAAQRTLAERLVSYIALLQRDAKLAAIRQTWTQAIAQRDAARIQHAARLPIIDTLGTIVQLLQRDTRLTQTRTTMATQQQQRADLTPRQTALAAAVALLSTYHTALDRIAALTQRAFRLSQAKEAIIQPTEKLAFARGSLARRKILLPHFDAFPALAARLTRLGQARDAIGNNDANRAMLQERLQRAAVGKTLAADYAESVKAAIGHCPTCGGDLCQQHAA